MVFKYKHKTGQAAIEFLMTYGWMLLVVLIVGALVFSFVDFTTLLPNKVELNNNLRAMQEESYARIGAVAAANSHVLVTFKYQGAQRITIDAGDVESKISTDLDGSCDLVWIKNSDTEEATDLGATVAAFGGYAATTAAVAGKVTFINGQTGFAIYECIAAYNLGNGFREDDTLEGTIALTARNAKTGVPIPSTGPLRLSIIE